jgi:hypothetical protein
LSTTLRTGLVNGLTTLTLEDEATKAVFNMFAESNLIMH